MPSWISKQLVEQLVDLTISYLCKVKDAISYAPAPSPWPADDHVPTWVGDGLAEPAPATPAATEPAPQPEPAPAPAPTPAAQLPGESSKDPAATLTAIQTALRDIARTEGPDWITETLFKKYGVTTLTDIPQDQYESVLQDIIDKA